MLVELSQTGRARDIHLSQKVRNQNDSRALGTLKPFYVPWHHCYNMQLRHRDVRGLKRALMSLAPNTITTLHRGLGTLVACDVISFEAWRLWSNRISSLLRSFYMVELSDWWICDYPWKYGICDLSNGGLIFPSCITVYFGTKTFYGNCKFRQYSTVKAPLRPYLDLKIILHWV